MLVMSVRSETSTSKQTQASIPINTMILDKQRKEFGPVCWIGLEGLIEFDMFSIHVSQSGSHSLFAFVLKSIVSDSFPFGVAILQAPAPRNDTQAPQWVWAQRWQRQQGPAGPALRGQRHVQSLRQSLQWPWRWLWLRSTMDLSVNAKLCKTVKISMETYGHEMELKVFLPLTTAS